MKDCLSPWFGILSKDCGNKVGRHNKVVNISICLKVVKFSVTTRNYPVFNRVDIKDSIDPPQEFGTQLALTPLVSDALHHLVKYHQMDPSLYYEVPMKGVCIVQDSHVPQPPPCLCHGCGP